MSEVPLYRRKLARNLVQGVERTACITANHAEWSAGTVYQAEWSTKRNALLERTACITADQAGATRSHSRCSLSHTHDTPPTSPSLSQSLFLSLSLALALSHRVYHGRPGGRDPEDVA